MSAANTPQPVDWTGSPEQLVAAWPGEMPLAALCSGVAGPSGPGRWSRWSFLTAPAEVRALQYDDPDPLGRMTKIIGTSSMLRPEIRHDANEPPFQGGWLVALGYGLGGVIEPKAAATKEGLHNPLWPWSIVLWRCPGAYAHDGRTGTWWQVGVPEGLPALAGREARERDSRVPWLWSLEGRDVYVANVRRAIELIRSGDIFQVNLAHRMAGALDGSARGMFCRMLRAATPWYGAYLEVEERGQWHNAHFGLSMSPELFLEFDARTRTLTTRPIKGTRAAGGEAALGASAKDRAELNMIIDLMRNDLGRIAEIGSVRVEDTTRIERHAEGRAGMPGDGAVVHGVGTVSARVRPEVGFADIIRATFPGGSITGAPKIRAMQVINELHGGARGLYTGAIGYLADNGNFALSIAIRTAMVLDKRETARPRGKGGRAIDEVEEATLSFPVGAGIVADSDPESEWRETLDKARAFANLVEPARPARANGPEKDER